MSPRRSVLDARVTRQRIVARAAEIASVEGLDGVTIGRLAGDLSMSKSGVMGHFGTKQALQLATVRDVAVQFRRTVVETTEQYPQHGTKRILALCDSWIAYLASTGLPGGCLLTAAATEFDGRPGEVRKLVIEVWGGWRDLLAEELKGAVDAGELPADFDVDQALFELVAIGPALNQALQLHGDTAAIERARYAVRRIVHDP